MVAKITSGKSLINALNYNENKVKKGAAQLIGANGYVKDIEKLSFYDKLLRLTDLASRNQLTKTNAVHISLNFSPGEHLEQPTLNAIADTYMQRIGFGDQPYLVYRHEDAGHPHIHIVSTNIKRDGERISLHNIGKESSEPARKAIEIEYKLVRADAKKNDTAPEHEVNMKPLVYGQDETKKTLSNVVNRVVRDYRFTSLPELNAVLKNFNVLADRGSKESVMFKKNGLRYWITDSKGQKMGVPLKASALYKKPTIKLLEDRFRLNELLRKPAKEQLKIKIDQAVFVANTMARFEKELQKKQVSALIRKNPDGRVYGITFIDEMNKVVFNGSDLGKKYSAAGIMQQFDDQQRHGLRQKVTQAEAGNLERADLIAAINSGKSLLEALLDPATQHETVPYPLRKRKKRRNLNL